MATEESNLAKISHVAQIVGLIPSFICAGEVVKPKGGVAMSKTLLISFVAALTCFLIGGIFQLVLLVQKKRHPGAPSELSAVPTPPSKLIIHSAVWGPIKQATPGMLDKDVLPKIKAMPKDGLFILASNSNFGDHAANQRKRLKVIYSYENSIDLTAEREEDGILILPEHPLLRTFSSLQIDALLLAQNLSRLLMEFPIPLKTAYGYTNGRFSTATEVHAWGDALRSSQDEMAAKYALDFREDALKISHRLVDRRLGELANTAKKHEDFIEIISILQSSVFSPEITT